MDGKSGVGWAREYKIPPIGYTIRSSPKRPSFLLSVPILYGSPVCSIVSGVFICPLAVRMGKMSRIENFLVFTLFLGRFLLTNHFRLNILNSLIGGFY